MLGTWCVAAEPCALGLCGLRGNCACRCEIVTVIHKGAWRMEVWVWGLRETPSG